jgi:hypothetical protein
MTKITLDIKTCQECPFIKKDRHYTSDSFELAFDWFCTRKKEKGHDKKISGYVEWHEEDKVPVPKWCPLKK